MASGVVGEKKGITHSTPAAVFGRSRTMHTFCFVLYPRWSVMHDASSLSVSDPLVPLPGDARWACLAACKKTTAYLEAQAASRPKANPTTPTVLLAIVGCCRRLWCETNWRRQPNSKQQPACMYPWWAMPCMLCSACNCMHASPLLTALRVPEALREPATVKVCC
jgi:hypothetical protein